jgi:hypothetical protein
MQIKTNLDAFKNVKLQLPVVGETEVIDGIIDVPDEVAELLLIGDNWSKIELVANEAENTQLLTELGEVKSEDGDVGIEDDLAKLNLDEMIKLATDAKLKGFQLFLKDESRMRAFLRKKLKAATV